MEQFVHSMLYVTCTSIISVRSTSAYQLGLASMCARKGCTVRQHVAPTSSCQLPPVVNMRPTERIFLVCLRSSEVARVSGYRYRGLGFDSRRYQIF